MMVMIKTPNCAREILCLTSFKMMIIPSQLPALQFFKLTNSTEIHHGFHYSDGLNTDHVTFNPTGQCSPGGLYFFDETQLPYFPLYISEVVYIRKVTFPVDAQIYCEQGKYKADRFILSERKEFYLDDHVGEEAVLAAVKQDGETLKYVQEQTEAICLAAVRQYSGILEHVKEQTEAICLAAVKQDGYALKHVQEQTEEICLAAVQWDGYALKYVQEQTEAICLAAVQRDGYALKYVQEQTEEICLAAVQRDGYALEHVKEQTEAICLAAVQRNSMALKYVQEQTEAICWAAHCSGKCC